MFGIRYIMTLMVSTFFLGLAFLVWLFADPIGADMLVGGWRLFYETHPLIESQINVLIPFILWLAFNLFLSWAIGGFKKEEITDKV